ncbi:PAS domain S-box-containing protein [Noviherbaspirillum humi]|uniref:histidine kinase n=1 Tax=Noviherbaspirillum humi TaxID=1688639 RepID=A0A239DEG8_9BURK|nr:histidine kinase [Noviherbaspirillum humi]SNS30204.1 PAS domain S-box-containing protein [Noviherbaspirillum humi]
MTIQPQRSHAPDMSSSAAMTHFEIASLAPSLLTNIHSGANGVLIIDETLQVVLVNRRAEQMFGYPAGSLLGQPLERLVPLDRNAEARERIDQLGSPDAAARRSRCGLRGVRMDGVEVPLSAYVSRLPMHENAYIALVIRADMRLRRGRNRRTQYPRAAELRRLALSSQQAHEQEKKRVSKELYDDIAQRLSVLKLDLEWLDQHMPAGNDPVFARITQMQGMLDNVISITKSMASSLRPPLLDDFGLLPALEWITEKFEKKTGISCRLDTSGLRLPIADPLVSAIFRVVQETLISIERQNHASMVNIRLTHAAGKLELIIEDDGIGVPREASSTQDSYGLVTMQERIFILGGTITIMNKSPRGVAIRATMPADPLPAS